MAPSIEDKRGPLRGFPFSGGTPLPRAALSYIWLARLQPALHPVFDALLRRFCREKLLDFELVRKIVVGAEPAPDFFVTMIETTLGVPASAWRNYPISSPISAPQPPPPPRATPRPRAAAAPSLAIGPKGRQSEGGMTRQEQGAIIGRQRRRLATPEAVRIFAWMDAQDPPLTTAQLAERVAQRIGRRLSRSSLGHYIAGYQTKAAGMQAPSFAPADVRIAIEQISGGAIPRNAWPLLGE